MLEMSVRQQHSVRMGWMFLLVWNMMTDQGKIQRKSGSSCRTAAESEKILDKKKVQSIIVCMITISYETVEVEITIKDALPESRDGGNL